MSSSGGRSDGRITRRSFLKYAGAFAVVGATAASPVNLTHLVQRLGLQEMVRAPVTEQDSSAGQVSPDSFSIFWITDTQFLSETNPALFEKMTRWIVDNWSAYNGKLVIHTGDIVQDGGVEEEWINADEAMSVFLNNGIPYSWCAGNHDDWINGDPTTGWKGNLWTSAFNPSTVGEAINRLGYAHWAGDYHDGMNTAVSFTANGLDFLVANVEWKGDSNTLKWLGDLMDDPAYVNHNVIVAPHAYINASGSLDDPAWSADLAGFIAGLTPILDEHSPNVFLTLNGHFATDCGYNTPSMLNGRNELMFDRQDSLDLASSPLGRGVDDSGPGVADADKVGGATVTILTFEPAANQINVGTYDPYVEEWRVDPYEQYTIPMFYVSPAHGLIPPLMSYVTY